MINIEKLLPFLGNIDEDGRYIKIVKFVIKNIPTLKMQCVLASPKAIQMKLFNETLKKSI